MKGSTATSGCWQQRLPRLPGKQPLVLRRTVPEAQHAGRRRTASCGPGSTAGWPSRRPTSAFATSDKLKIEQIWMNVYHGGTKPSPYDQHLFIDNVVDRHGSTSARVSDGD